MIHSHASYEISKITSWVRMFHSWYSTAWNREVLSHTESQPDVSQQSLQYYRQHTEYPKKVMPVQKRTSVRHDLLLNLISVRSMMNGWHITCIQTYLKQKRALTCPQQRRTASWISENVPMCKQTIKTPKNFNSLFDKNLRFGVESLLFSCPRLEERSMVCERWRIWGILFKVLKRPPKF